MSLTIVLPWPPTGLSPNARTHWAQLAKLKRQYREAVRERHVTLTQAMRQISENKAKESLHRPVETALPADRQAASESVEAS